MATKGRPALAVVPFLQRESLCVGIDVGKKEHVAAFVSRTLLESAKRYEACPVMRFENNRLGFRARVTRIGEYVPLEQAFVLVEKTGHYHLALRDYLLEMDLTVHESAPMERKHEICSRPTSATRSVWRTSSTTSWSCTPRWPTRSRWYAWPCRPAGWPESCAVSSGTALNWCARRRNARTSSPLSATSSSPNSHRCSRIRTGRRRWRSGRNAPQRTPSRRPH